MPQGAGAVEDSILRRIVALAIDALDAPIGFISFAAAGRQLVRVQIGISGPLRTADALLPAELIGQPDPIVITDTQAPDWRGLIPAADLLDARFAVILPIGAPGEADAGTLCVLDTAPRAEPDARKMRMLAGFAALAGAERWPAPSATPVTRPALHAGQLDTVFREAKVGIVHRALDGHLLMANDHYRMLVGRTQTELEILPAQIHVHPDDLARNEGKYRQHVESGTPFRIELRYIRPDASVIWCEVNLSFVRDDSGAIRSVVSIVQDITRRRHAELALRESREHHRHSVELNPQIQWTARPDGSIEEVGPLWTSLTGGSVEQARGDGWVEALHVEDVVPTVRAWQEAIRLRRPVDIEYRLRCGDSYRWMRARAAPRCDEQGEIIRWYGTLEDIHDRKAAQQTLTESEERLRLAVQAARLGVWDYDTITGERRWSEELLEMLGLPSDAEPTMAAAMAIVHPDDRQKFQSVVASASGGLLPAGFEIALRIRRGHDGAQRWLKSTGWKTVSGSGHLSRLIVTFQDVTEERDAEERIRWAATHDPLTNLPNRLALQEELESATERAKGTDEQIGLMLFDVDNLKRINDTLGHDAGDALLRVFARRLAAVAPAGATIGRLGGDEFAIVMPAIRGAGDIDRCAAMLLESLRAPFAFNGRTLDCAASIGASIFPEHGYNPTELLKSADLALYAAKTAGRGRTRIFHPEMRTDLQRQFSMINLAKDALANARIEAFYQPKIDLNSHRLVGFEALLRWQDPQGGIHMPADIRAAFDDPDLSIEITDRMLGQVTGDLRRWIDQGHDPVSIAVNTSANDFRYDNFAERVLASLEQCGLPAALLEIEVTETVFLGRGAQFVDRALRMLSAAGIRIALDDFGTGYASLSHLKQYPVDVLKIDRSFISNLENSPDDAAIADAVIDLGRNLGIVIVAEGVETKAQADHLRDRGCAVGQGFLFGHPATADEIFPRWRDGFYRG
ncbi:MAG: EAL domain-containing protein [Sphingomonas sp.]|jgi:diguanylate cyclase (GGDEF)-like protein/PAS domain S-box-containing protein|uniref:sensor domain-containing protein n=1 Tax=Sphingomonas sp. TaxID=28214 RepID=UPI0035669DA8